VVSRTGLKSSRQDGERRDEREGQEGAAGSKRQGDSGAGQVQFRPLASAEAVGVHQRKGQQGRQGGGRDEGGRRAGGAV
jgi:hypothetical protein